MSLLWLEAGAGRTTMVPVKYILQHYRPTEHSTWDDTRRDFEQEHPVVMNALRDDLKSKGPQRPVQAVAHPEGGWEIANGHHRILAADDIGLSHLPVDHYESYQDLPRKKEYWNPETRAHYGPEDDPDDEGQVRY